MKLRKLATRIVQAEQAFVVVALNEMIRADGLFQRGTAFHQGEHTPHAPPDFRVATVDERGYLHGGTPSGDR
jgi:hypothetical protein